MLCLALFSNKTLWKKALKKWGEELPFCMFGYRHFPACFITEHRLVKPLLIANCKCNLQPDNDQRDADNNDYTDDKAV